MNIFLVDDHPMTIDGYCNLLLSGNFVQEEIVFTTANNCEEAYLALLKAISSEQLFDIAIVDKSLPEFEEKSIFSGCDVAALIRKKMPNCKIIIITGHTEFVIIYDIVRKINPEGFLIKNDVSFENLCKAVNDVINGIPYQSVKVKNSINEIWKKELMVEENNRQILLLLSKGFKTKELESIINLTTSTIQKRIIRMKTAFDVHDDSSLVKEAIRLGFI